MVARTVGAPVGVGARHHRHAILALVGALRDVVGARASQALLGPGAESLGVPKAEAATALLDLPADEGLLHAAPNSAEAESRVARAEKVRVGR